MKFRSTAVVGEASVGHVVTQDNCEWRITAERESEGRGKVLISDGGDGVREFPQQQLTWTGTTWVENTHPWEIIIHDWDSETWIQQTQDGDIVLKGTWRELVETADADADGLLHLHRAHLVELIPDTYNFLRSLFLMFGIDKSGGCLEDLKLLSPEGGHSLSMQFSHLIGGNLEKFSERIEGAWHSFIDGNWEWMVAGECLTFCASCRRDLRLCECEKVKLGWLHE